MLLQLESCRINVMVADMDAAVDFYCNTIGFKLTNRYGNHYAELDGPDLSIGLHPKNDGIVQGKNLSIGLGVKDFDDNVKMLQKKGIHPRVQSDGWIRLAHFTDPDGNELFLAERK